MNGRKLCLGLSSGFGASEEEQIRLFRSSGFDGFFAAWREGIDLKSLKRVADEQGMLLQSVHAPFLRAADFWKQDEALSRAATEELIACIEDSAEAGAPVVVVHAFIGFDDHTPTPYGPQNFEKAVKRAEELGLKVAFENTEGEEFLASLMEHFRGNGAVGFCLDTGHEMCYNHGKDMLSLYGDRLLCTHLNDNLGIGDANGKITWLDDLHLLPFDGKADWREIAARLNRHGFAGELTFELSRQSKPGRHENDGYASMSLEEYLAEAYDRACKVASLITE